jgi:deoxyadenosine kinase
MSNHKSNPKIESIQNNNILLSEDNFIGISGIIGAGKTTLAKELGKVMNLPVYYEPIVENEYLTDFYSDMKRYSFSFQIYLLNERFRQHQQVLWNGTGGVQDRTLYEDSVFAKVLYEQGNMEEREYKTYLNLFRNRSNFMKKNTLIVRLDVEPQEAAVISATVFSTLLRFSSKASSCSLLAMRYKDFIFFRRDFLRSIEFLRTNAS